MAKKISRLQKALGKKPAGGDKKDSSSAKKKKPAAKKVAPAAVARQVVGDTPPEHKSSSAQKALREVTDEELEKILVDHREWIISKSKEGKRAELGKCNLREKYLQGALL